MKNKKININDFHDDILFRYSDSYIDQYVELQITQDIVRNEFFNKKSVIGMMSCHDANISDFVLASRTYAWSGGDKPPVPDGVSVLYYQADGSTFERNVHWNIYLEHDHIIDWRGDKNLEHDSIIAFQILGLVDDGELGYEETQSEN